METVTLPKPDIQRILEISRIVTEGIGAIRKSQYSGHECVAIAELLFFLKNFNQDLKKQELAAKQMPTFGEQNGKQETAKAAGEESIPGVRIATGGE